MSKNVSDDNQPKFRRGGLMYKLRDAKIDPHAGVRTLSTAVMSLNPTNRENGNMEKDILCRSEVR